MSVSTLPVKVIYIDDDRTLLIVAKMALKNSRFLLVKGCVSGQDALTFLSASTDKPDLILLDANMPELDGIQTLIRLRTELVIEAPVIFMTAHLHEDQVQQLEELGILGIIHKPFDPGELVSKLDALWSVHHPSSTSSVSVSPELGTVDAAYPADFSLDPVLHEFFVRFEINLNDLIAFEAKERKNESSEAGREQLRFLAHKMVGTGALFGFPEVSDKAKQLEMSMISHRAFLDDLVELIGLCRQVLSSNKK